MYKNSILSMGWKMYNMVVITHVACKDVSIICILYILGVKYHFKEIFYEVKLF